MSGLSRRVFLSSLGAAIGLGAFGNWLPKAAAADAPMRIRYDASSPEGLAMLGVYREAVKRMLDRGTYPWHHPLSWRFQANTHLFPMDEPVDTEIFKLAGDANDAEIKRRRRLALGSDVAGQFLEGIWASCPHHDPGQYFLPWHRLYLAYFEQIIEKIAGKPFSLPYWNYLNPKARTLPEPFRAETVNGEANALYFQFRNPQFLSEGLNESVLDILQKARFEVLLREPVLLTSPPRNGFSMELESTLHDVIHSAVGLREGMGSPEFAARDPIFWLHHANIDRIWESWRLPAKDGTSVRDPVAGNPWRTVRFQFVNTDGQETSADIALSLLAASNLGYRYDNLERVPPPPAALTAESALKAPTMLWESAGAQKSIRTPQDIVTVPLVPAQLQSAIADVTRNPAVRFELSIDLNTGSEPGLYQIFLTGRERDGAMSAERKIGTFSLFSARGSHIHHHGASDARVDTAIRIDITDQVRNNVINPNKVGEIIIRPAYLSETVNVLVKNVKIIAK